MSHFPEYAEYAERQARLDYVNDQHRFTVPAPAPAAWTTALALDVLGTIQATRSALDTLESQVLELLAPHYLDATGTVALGHKATADAQRQADDAAGGLVALALRGTR